MEQNKREKVDKLWEKYESYKDTAEQHEFPLLVMFDSLLVPAYKDLNENWNEQHADSFIRGMLTHVFPTLGIEYDE